MHLHNGINKTRRIYLLWYNYPGDDDLKLIMTLWNHKYQPLYVIIILGFGLGLLLPLMLDTEYVCIFDDDTSPRFKDGLKIV
jgi:hypothetical protein